MIELRQILCPLDFSEFSQRALDRAFAIARRYGSTITALHVVSPGPVAALPGPYSFGSGMPPSVVLPRIDPAVITAQVQRLVDSEQVPGVPVNILVEESPVVYREILSQADRLKADLVVMGTHGRSGFERLFIGSTAERVLRKARCPVLTVPPKASDAMPPGPVPFAQILCAIDFSPCSKVALDYAISLAGTMEATLTLVHVIEVFPHDHEFSPPPAIDVTAWTLDAERRLREMVSNAVRARCTVREVVSTGKAYREILELAAHLGSELIVMGVQGRGAADLFFFGSTTHHVVREAPCPVLTLRE